MKFSIQREVILRPLTQVVGVVERRQTLPVLANLLVNASGEQVRFTGTDLEVEMVAQISVPVERDGEVTIPARKLLDICKALPDGTLIEIDANDEKAVVKAGRSRFTLATLAATEFPSVEDLEFTDSVNIPQHQLNSLIEQTGFAMANQDVRYYLNGLLLELRSGLLRCVATDGHRLAIADTEAELGVSDTRQIIVPRKGVLELSRLLSDTEDDVALQIGRSHVRAQLADTVFTSKLIDGRFPDYESVVPVGADQIVTGDRLAVREALQRAAILSNEKYRGVRLEVAPGKLKIVAHNPEQEEAVEEVEVETGVDSLAVGFNVNYLLDGLSALSSETVELCLKDANSSCLVKAPQDSHARHVIMPLRL